MLEFQPKETSAIVEERSHIIYHETSFAAARAILQEGRIHGRLYGGNRNCLVPYPHFMYLGWPNTTRSEPAEISLIFGTDLPARCHQAGAEDPLPEPGFLEIYLDLKGGIKTISLHPDNPPLTLIKSDPSSDDITNDLRPRWLSWREAPQKRLRRELALTLETSTASPILIWPSVEWDHI